jgi:hypothetical protein
MCGFDVEFTAPHYGLKTTPKKEYNISVGQQDCPEEDKKDKQGRLVRVIQGIETLKKLDVCRRAKLIDAEILTVVSALLL